MAKQSLLHNRFSAFSTPAVPGWPGCYRRLFDRPLRRNHVDALDIVDKTARAIGLQHLPITLGIFEL